MDACVLWRPFDTNFLIWRDISLEDLAIALTANRKLGRQGFVETIDCDIHSDCEVGADLHNCLLCGRDQAQAQLGGYRRWIDRRTGISL